MTQDKVTQPKYEKLERDGKIAVLVSPGYGAGWYTWNHDCEGLLFDKDLVEAVFAGNNDKCAELAQAKYGKDVYTGGAEQLQVEWVAKGTPISIREYDGSETLEEYHNHDAIA